MIPGKGLFVNVNNYVLLFLTGLRYSNFHKVLSKLLEVHILTFLIN